MHFLYFSPQMAALAEKISTSYPEIQLGVIEWHDFKDGFPNLKVNNAPCLRQKEIAFLASFDSPYEIFRQLAVIYEIPRFAVGSYKIILPYYPTGTMERVEREGQIATAATLARMLSATPMSMSGPAQIVIFDIHALQERFYFSDTVIPRLETAIPLLKNRLASVGNLAVAFPDEGAMKRFGFMFDQIPLITCQKVRIGEKRLVSIKEGNPEGKHVVIVDDLVMTGGTLLESAKILRQHGAIGVSAYATHGVFPQQSWKKFVEAGFDHFWLTDSCPQTTAAIHHRSPFEILSLKDTVARIILEK
jgi:ribose-phosphate pyrophosphokinase